jgi:hypothetical protein
MRAKSHNQILSIIIFLYFVKLIVKWLNHALKIYNHPKIENIFISQLHYQTIYFTGCVCNKYLSFSVNIVKKNQKKIDRNKINSKIAARMKWIWFINNWMNILFWKESIIFDMIIYYDICLKTLEYIFYIGL